MTIASNQRIARLEQRLDQVEAGLQVLLRATDIENHPAIVKLRQEIQAMKARMGKVREPA